MKRRGADLLVKALEQAKVRYVFALSGNHIMSLFDAVLDTTVDFVHVRHEAAAVHMADASARLTGKPGIALVTAGPGYANAVAALYTAACSESPVVLLSGQSPSGEFGRGSFQEMNQVDIAKPLTKASWTVRSPAALASDLAKAMKIAQTDRPGPVHLSLPSDVLEGEASFKVALRECDFAPDARVPCFEQLRNVARVLREASSPLVICGPQLGTPRNSSCGEQFARKTGVPLIVMESPRGINDPGKGRLADVLRGADVVLLLNRPLDFMLKFGKAFAEGCCTLKVENVDAIATLKELEGLLGSKSSETWRRKVEEDLTYRPKEWSNGLTGEGRRIHPIDVCNGIQETVGKNKDAVLVCDGGEFGQWVQAGVKFHSRIVNGPAGAIGAAIPFAIAASLVCGKEVPVIAAMGDGTFGFHMAEFDTACRYDAPFIAVVGNDACWNAEYQIQLRSFGQSRAQGCELRDVRYDGVADSLGGLGERVSSVQELRPALERAVKARRPSCINVSIDRLPAPSFASASKN